MTAKGKQEARDIGLRLAKIYKEKISAIYTSPLARAQQTAEEIAVHLKAPIKVEPLLIEKCHGQHDDMEGATRNAFTQKMDKIREEAFQKEYPNTPFPRFFRWDYEPLFELPVPEERRLHPFKGELETLHEVYNRGVNFFKEAGKNHPGEVILAVTHGGFTDTMAQGIASEGNEELLFRFYDPRLPGDKRLSFPKHGAAYKFHVYSDGKITFEGVETLTH